MDTKNVADVTKDMLMSMMVGREIGDIYNISHAVSGEELLKVEGLSHKKYFRDISFRLKAGEILGFSGLVGAGRSEVMRALFGLEKLEAGEIYIKGKKAVSYTHLDVYKRQVFTAVMRQKISRTWKRQELRKRSRPSAGSKGFQSCARLWKPVFTPS